MNFKEDGVNFPFFQPYQTFSGNFLSYRQSLYKDISSEVTYRPGSFIYVYSLDIMILLFTMDYNL